jgi:hypothetical protein
MTDKKYYCQVSGKEISAERIEALIMLGVPEQQWTCVEHSMTKPKQGIFMGEHGTSDLLLVNKVYDDSVRGVFKSAGKEEESEDGAADIPESPQQKPGFYTEKEINYYSAGGGEDSDDLNPGAKNTNNRV